MAKYKQTIDYSQYKNWDDLKKAIDTKNMIPTEYHGPAGPEFEPFYRNMPNQQNWGAPTDQYIPGIGRATAIDADAPDSTPNNPYDDYNQNDPYSITNHKRPEKVLQGLEFANPDKEGWNYQLKPGADGSLIRSEIDRRPHGFLEKALDVAPMALGAAMTGAGFAGMLPGAGAASAGTGALSGAGSGYMGVGSSVGSGTGAGFGATESAGALAASPEYMGIGSSGGSGAGEGFAAADGIGESALAGVPEAMPPEYIGAGSSPSSGAGAGFGDPAGGSWLGKAGDIGKSLLSNPKMLSTAAGLINSLGGNKINSGGSSGSAGALGQYDGWNPIQQANADRFVNAPRATHVNPYVGDVSRAPFIGGEHQWFTQQPQAPKWDNQNTMSDYINHNLYGGVLGRAPEQNATQFWMDAANKNNWNSDQLGQIFGKSADVELAQRPTENSQNSIGALNAANPIKGY